MKYDILVAGEINPDILLSDPDLNIAFGQQETLVEHARLAIGSSSAIFACAAARLGLRVGFVGVAGDDILGRFMLEAMAERGVDISHVIIDPLLPTGFSVILSRGADRAILTYLGAVPALTSSQVSDELLKQSRHLHVASYFLQTALKPGLAALYERARQFGVSTSLDTNWDPSSEWRGLEALLRQVDVFLPNKNEALAITGETEINKASEKLTGLCRVLAVKLGSRGGLARSGSQVVAASALPVQVSDTVGAGDTFDAGFLYGYLDGWSLKPSLELACACGSLSTRLPGGDQAQPTLEEAASALRANGLDEVTSLIKHT